MRFIEQLSVASAFVTLTSSSPIEKRDSQTNQAFTVYQTVQKPYILSGPAAMAKTYGKYGKAAPADVVSAAANNDGTVVASPEE